MKKKQPLFIFLSILFLAVIFVIQGYYLYKNTVANSILDYNKESFENDYNYSILESLTETLLKNIDDKDEKVITLVFNNETSPYKEFGIGYLYVRYLVFPMKMYTSYEYYNDINEKKYLDNQIKNEGLDYILLLGKNTKLFNQISTKDYTLYKVTNKDTNELEEVASTDFSLYAIYSGIENKNDQQEFDNMIENIKNMIEEDWSFSAIELMKQFANDLYVNSEYDLAIEYSIYYLNTVDYINEILNMNLGNIYTQTGDYGQAILHYQICQRNQACDFETAQQMIEELTEKEAG